MIPNPILRVLSSMRAHSVRSLHRPAPDAAVGELVERSSAAWRRVKFDELLAQQLSMRMAYRAAAGA